MLLLQSQCKNKTTLLMVVLFPTLLLAQKFPESEVNFQTRGASSSTQETIFEVKPISFTTIIDGYTETIRTTTYRYDLRCNVGMQDIWDQSLTLKGNVSCGQSGLEYIFYDESWVGGAACSDNSEYKPFANALYEILIKVDGVEKFKFYLDTRHNSLPNGCDNNCGGNDISIVYYIDSNKVRSTPNLWSPLEPIIYNGYYTWWELRKNNCSPAFSKFNGQYMPVLLEPVNQNYHPYIQWLKPSSLSAEENFWFYDLQRSINFGPFYTIYTSTNINSTSYLDGGVYWIPNQSATNVRYRIAALYSEGSIIDVSNYREITTVDMHLWKSATNKSITEYYLNQNYPNPFNPNTEISYSLAKPGIVTLVIYDLLGSEVIKLVDEYKDAGVNRVAFNASELSTGIYFYTLRVNDYFETKTMVFVK